MQDAILEAISDEDGEVRVRALRVYEHVGDERGLPTLETRFGDQARTRWGVAGDVAREVHAAIASEIEPCGKGTGA